MGGMGSVPALLLALGACLVASFGVLVGASPRGLLSPHGTLPVHAVSTSPFVRDTSHIGLGSTFLQCDFILITAAVTLLPNKATF